MQVFNRSSFFFRCVIGVLLGLALGVVAESVLPGSLWLGPLLAVIIIIAGLRRPLRRRRAVRSGIPSEWAVWLRENIPFYRKISAADKRRFERDVQIYLAEQAFEGVGGAEIDDELKLFVAASAAIMLHGRPQWELPFNRTILFYPGVFDEEYLFDDTDEGLFDGMVHGQGPVILSARAVRQDWARPYSGHNVVFHEMAHLLDFKNAAADGIPSLMERGSEYAWSELVSREINRIKTGRSLLRDYGATSSVEFFAVAVENFFERPGQLKRGHRELYDALVQFFNLDMASLMSEEPLHQKPTEDPSSV